MTPEYLLEQFALHHEPNFQEDHGSDYILFIFCANVGCEECGIREKCIQSSDLRMPRVDAQQVQTFKLKHPELYI